MDIAETVARLTSLVHERENFVHVRFGDGDVMFATGTGSVITGDGEEWNPRLSRKLLVAWWRFANHGATPLLIGDLTTYAQDDGVGEQWKELVGSFWYERTKGFEKFDPEWVHMEALRVGFGHALPFYEAVRDDRRRKVFVGPLRLEPISKALGCVHIEAPLQVAHEHASELLNEVVELGPDVALIAAGRGGKILQGLLCLQYPELTQIDVGSGLDLLIDDGVRRGTDLGVDREAILTQYRQAGLCTC